MSIVENHCSSVEEQLEFYNSANNNVEQTATSSGLYSNLSTTTHKVLTDCKMQSAATAALNQLGQTTTIHHHQQQQQQQQNDETLQVVDVGHVHCLTTASQEVNLAAATSLLDMANTSPVNLASEQTNSVQFVGSSPLHSSPINLVANDCKRRIVNETSEHAKRRLLMQQQQQHQELKQEPTTAEQSTNDPLLIQTARMQALLHGLQLPYYSPVPSTVARKAFSCVRCGKTLSSQHNLRLHEATIHQGLFQFRCPICGKGLRQERDLRGHLANRHDWKKEFRCAVCGHEFGYKRNLKQHMTSHHRWTDNNPALDTTTTTTTSTTVLQPSTSITSSQ